MTSTKNLRKLIIKPSYQSAPATGSRSSTHLLMTQCSNNYGQPYTKDGQRVVQTSLNRFDMKDLLTVQDNLVFKGQCLVVPASLRKELITVVYSSHIDIEGCIRRACDTLYWPHMATELRDYISKCDICLSHHIEQSKEPLLQHEVIARPWAKVAADLCQLDNRTLLVITDYYSNFIEVARIIKEMKAVFARYGIPDILFTDNVPQFVATEFAVFAKSWMFQHITSSPHHPQSNEKAKNVVKTVKRLFTKCSESGQ